MIRLRSQRSITEPKLNGVVLLLNQLQLKTSVITVTRWERVWSLSEKQLGKT